MAISIRVPAPRARNWLFIALAWLAVALVFVFQNYVVAVSRNQSVVWVRALWLELEYWLVFLAFTPILLRLSRRFRLDGENRWRNVGALVAAGLLFALVQPVVCGLLMYATVVAIWPASDPQRITVTALLVQTYPLMCVWAAWRYAVVIGVISAFNYYSRFKDQQLQTAQLEAQLVTAQLRTLKAQLHPHFLFNALNSAAMLTIIDPRRAHRVLLEIADLLRTALRGSAQLEVPLAEELDFLDRYLRIERVRFEDRLTVRFEIEEGAEDLMVPSLILQPLVENAVHHGFSADSSARVIVVRARQRGADLMLEVEDDGAGLPHDWSFEKDARVGLSNVQARVDASNRRPRPLEIHRGAHGGTRVTLSLRPSLEASMPASPDRSPR